MLEVGGGGGVAGCAGQRREGGNRGFMAVEGEPSSDTGKDVAPVGVRAAPTGAEQDTTQDSEGQPKAKLEVGAEQGGGEVERRGTNVDRARGDVEEVVAEARGSASRDEAVQASGGHGR